MSFWQIFGGRCSGLDSEIPDRAPRSQQREHRGLQQQEVLAARFQDEADEAWCKSVSPQESEEKVKGPYKKIV